MLVRKIASLHNPYPCLTKNHLLFPVGRGDALDVTRSTPAKEGYSMPAEWERHEATWISWPHPSGASFPSAYHRVVPAFVEMVKALTESEIVRINVRNTEQEAEVRALLGDGLPGSLEFFHVPTNEPWCRDHGPIFLKRRERPRLAAVNFGFNAWGYETRERLILKKMGDEVELLVDETPTT